ncbi:O-antigen ligase family protein [Winogradskyella sp.]|uniref:O-antigen ligase family protein n=1 Tax=Winogradskyella sp. TaxID=1883156 RepID=UPI00261E57A3|nr:O-antigen ligase family protein [Winogradskyella sp.]
MRRALSIKKLAAFIFLIGVFFIPFNSFSGFGILGEFDRDSCVLFFLISFVLLLFSGRVSIPIKSSIFQLVVLLLIWIALTAFFNVYDISFYYFKKTSGLSRFLRQYVALIISCVVLFILFFNIIKNQELKTIVYLIRRVFLFSLIIVVIYGTIEYLIVQLKVDSLRETLLLFDYFPFTKVKFDRWTYRISSVTFESPALATYLISIAGWMFSYILTEKGLKRFIPAALVILFAFLSGSRAGFFIIIVQIIIFILYLMKDRKFKKLFVNIFLILFFSGSVLLVFFGRTTSEIIYNEVASFDLEDDKHSNSNKTRFGIQYAVFQVFLENPIIGVGHGMQAFEAKDKFPDWATKNNWEFKFKYLNEDHPNFPPVFNLYLRILAETGIIGFIIFLFLLMNIIFWCYNKTFIRQGNQTIMSLIITISMAGFLLNWLKMDTFRVYGFWLCLALLIVMDNQLKNEYK